MQLQTITAALALALVGSGLAMPCNHTLTPKRTLGKRSDASLIEAIMPKSTSCAGRGDECTTAEDAAEYVTGGLAIYVYQKKGEGRGIEQAGILALMAYESAEMQYKKNLDQAAQPGRGTASMQSGALNVEFAAALGLGSYTVDNVLDLTTNNKFNFYAASWYYNTSCPDIQRPTGSADTWFEAYMTCDGLQEGWQTSQPERWAYWESAKTAFSLT